MQQIQAQLEAVHLRTMIIRGWNIGIIGTSAACMFLLIIAWAIEWSAEGFNSRYASSFVAWLCVALTLGLSIMTLHVDPSKPLLIFLQIGAVASLSLTGVASGMNAVVVNVCSAGYAASTVSCGAHYFEFAVSLILCACVASIFGTTQQKIVLLVDRGVLTGLGSRMSKIDA